MHISAILTLLFVCLVQITQAQWWGDDSNERFDDDDSSPWGYGRGGGRRQRFGNRWGSDEDDDDDDWSRGRMLSRGFNRMAPRRNTWGRQQRIQQRNTQGGWSPNFLTGSRRMRGYDTPDFFGFFG
ncbi:aspartate and glycine-rich protein-like [Mizuhopecten yessoensis]|uniref:Uncharacterized protein n=1 Tax=Mizuhopecten yessoensis TaxID=6573 RepID=A0A210QZW0_MIZYE|nr:aspartate and glycine-rich protein-like [Mizuhopecten yessoensis]OWF54294.1 hypothetical protein KP79_PYT19760 [Mizuhopecten yessoensis]